MVTWEVLVFTTRMIRLSQIEFLDNVQNLTKIIRNEASERLFSSHLTQLKMEIDLKKIHEYFHQHLGAKNHIRTQRTPHFCLQANAPRRTNDSNSPTLQYITTVCFGRFTLEALPALLQFQCFVFSYFLEFHSTRQHCFSSQTGTCQNNHFSLTQQLPAN